MGSRTDPKEAGDGVDQGAVVVQEDEAFQVLGAEMGLEAAMVLVLGEAEALQGGAEAPPWAVEALGEDEAFQVVAEEPRGEAGDLREALREVEARQEVLQEVGALQEAEELHEEEEDIKIYWNVVSCTLKCVNGNDVPCLFSDLVFVIIKCIFKDNV